MCRPSFTGVLPRRWRWPPVPPPVAAAPTAEPEAETETDVEPNDGKELTKNACVRVRKTAQEKGLTAQQKRLRGKTGIITKLEDENLRYPGKIQVRFDATTTGKDKASNVNFERAHLRIVRGPPLAEVVPPLGTATSSSREGQVVGPGGLGEQPKKRFVLNQLVKVEALEEKQKTTQRKFLFRRGKVVGVPGSKAGQTYQIEFTEQRNGDEMGAKTTRKFLGRNLAEADDLQEPDESEVESENEDDEDEAAPQGVDRAAARGRKRKAADGAPAGGSRGKKKVVAPDVEENNALATCMEEEDEEKIYGGMIRALRAAKSSRSSGGVASQDDIENCKEALGRVHSVFLDAMMAKEEGDADGIPEEVNEILGKSLSSELRRHGKEGIVAAVNAIIACIKAENSLDSELYPTPVVAEVQA